MTDFEIIPDEERPPTTVGQLRTPMHTALLEGKTIFVPLNGRTVHSVQGSMRNFLATKARALRYRTVERDGVKGLVAWAEPKAAE